MVLLYGIERDTGVLVGSGGKVGKGIGGYGRDGGTKPSFKKPLVTENILPVDTVFGFPCPCTCPCVCGFAMDIPISPTELMHGLK